MAGKAVTEFVGGKGPRQHIWEAIRALHVKGVKEMSDDDVKRKMPPKVRAVIDISLVREYRSSLIAAEVLAVVTAGVPRRSAPTFRLAKDEGLEAPRVRRNGERVTQGLAQEQMWRTLRILAGDTNTRELAAHASTPAVPVAELAAKDYLQTLNQAGYLICTTEGKGTGKGGTPARYRLKPARNTGPRPPMICRTKVVYDPNEDKVVWAPTVTDEDAIHGN